MSSRAAAAAAWAAESTLRVAGGSAAVKWNTIQYRPELVAQLRTNMSWRIGMGGPTTLETAGVRPGTLVTT